MYGIRQRRAPLGLAIDWFSTRRNAGVVPPFLMATENSLPFDNLSKTFLTSELA